MRPLGTEPDEELVLRAQNGSEAHFGALVDRYTPNVYRLALGITGDHLEAEEVVQETFLRAYKHLDRFTASKAAFKTWLLAIARNQSINIFVTPVVTVSLSADVTSYDYSNTEVATSSVTATEVVLTNDGNVGITIEKSVWNDDSWDVTMSSTVIDGFDIWAMTKATETARPALGDFTSGNQHNFIETDLQEFNNLTDDSGNQADLDPNAKSDLWFRIDMPKKVSSSSQKVIHIRLKATGKNTALIDGTWQDIEFYTEEIMKLLEKERQKALKKGKKSYDDAKIIDEDYQGANSARGNERKAE